MTFGNRSIRIHLARGLAGFAALAVALRTMNSSLWPALIFLGLALWMLRGCPVCWTVGLFETIVMKIHRGAEDDRANRPNCAGCL